MKLSVIRTSGRNSQITVSDKLFARPNSTLLAQAVRVYLSNKRQGTSKTQTRSDVNRTTRKWYRQKGTGNARHGAKDANLFVGGAVAHGPTGQENWKKSLPGTQRKQALAAALTAQADNILINDELKDLKGKTKKAYQLLKQILKSFDETSIDQQKVLIVVKQKTEEMVRALKNIPDVTLLLAFNLNALAVASADKIILSNDALEILEEKIVG